MENSHYLTSKIERTSYGGYFLGQNIIFMLVLQYLMLFYTDVLGLSAAAVGTLFLVARIWDAINDPIMGIIVDKSNLKGGKFKPWVNMVIIILPLATAALFINPGFSAENNLLYAYVTYILWGMIYTISDVPIFALATVMTDQVDERVKIIANGRLAAGIAGMVCSIIAMPVITSLGWTEAAILLALISMLVMAPIKFYAVERTVNENKESASLKAMFSAVKNNKPLLAYNTAFLVSALTSTVMSASHYFAIYNLGSTDYVAILAMLGAVAGILLPLFIPKLVKRFGKKQIALWGIVLNIALSVIYFMVGYEDMMFVYVMTFLRGLVMNLPILLFGMITADCIEYGEYTTGTRSEGLLFSVQTFFTKLYMAISGAVGGFILSAIGYQANVEQTPEALNGIFAMNTVIPVIGLVGMFFVILFCYHLKEADVQKMVNEMKEKREAQPTETHKEVNVKRKSMI